MAKKSMFTTTIDQSLLERLRDAARGDDVPQNTILERALEAFFEMRDGKPTATKQEISVISDHDQLAALLETGAKLHTVLSNPIDGVQFVLVREVAR